MRAALASTILLGAALMAACDSDEEIEPTSSPPVAATVISTETPSPSLTQAPQTPWFLTGAPTPTRVEPVTDPALAIRFEEARDTWDAAEVQSYQYDLTWSCFCGQPGPLTVLVQDGQVASVSDSSGTALEIDGPSGFDEFFGRLLTIDGVFDVVANELSDELQYVMELTFDASLGFPSYLRSDWLGGTDGQFSVTIENFEQLP